MIDIKAYNEFLNRKVPITRTAGFEVKDSDISPSLFPHQREGVKWAVRGGCRALFWSFGLGKTSAQLEIVRLVITKEGGKGLIVAPLGVRQEFTAVDGPRLGMRVQYVRTQEEVDAADTPYLITNYERVRDGDIDPNQFTVTSLDEASVLRGYGTKTYQTFLKLFEDVPYKYVCTATPSPNKFKELIHYAGYLGIMDTGQALTRWFKRDSTQANQLTLMPHKAKEFWMWLASWALFLEYPSDLGFSDEGYVLPELKVFWHEIPVDHKDAWKRVDSFGQRFLFADAAKGLKEAAFATRQSIEARLAKTIEIINDGHEDDHWLIWHHLEDERRAISAAIPESKAVYGTQDYEKREDLILGFANGEYKILSTKPKIAGSGCNFQRHCHKNIFMGVNYKFNDFIQAVHRTHRFMQSEPVEIHVVYTEAQVDVCEKLRRKWEQHIELTNNMRSIVKEYGLTSEALKMNLQREMGVSREVVKSGRFTAVYNDTILETASMPSNSVDHILTSIPFGNHYEYVESYHDLGNNTDDDTFFEQMDFLVPNLYRVLKPGKVAAIHTKDRMMYGAVTGLGMYSVNPFSDKTVRAFVKHGFIYCGRISIDTDVVRENNQTYRLGWTEQNKDGTKMGVGSSEYVLLFVKPDEWQVDLDIGSEHYSSDMFLTAYQDALNEVKTLDNNSLDMIMTHITDGQFFGDAPIIIKNLHRALKSGRMACIHTWDMVDNSKIGKSGLKAVYPFSDRLVEEFTKQGFIYTGRITVESDVIRNEVGNVKKLNFDTKKGVGRPEYVLMFRKLPTDTSNAYADVPVVKNKEIYTRSDWQIDASGFWRSSGNVVLGQNNEPVYPQIDITERLINRFTNEDETIYDPFWKLTAVSEIAIQMDRFSHHIDLHEYEFNQIEWTLFDWVNKWHSDSFWKSDDNRWVKPADMIHMRLDSIGAWYREFSQTSIYDYKKHVSLGKELEKQGKLPASFMLFSPSGNSPHIWTDILRMKTLNTNQSQGRSEQHICPLQLDVIERLIGRFTQEGEKVYDPFGGIMSVPYQAVMMRCYGIGTELNHQYWADGIKYCQEAEMLVMTPTLFPLADYEVKSE